MSALGNIDIQVLNGVGGYGRIADNMRRRAMADNRAKSNVIKYHSNGLNRSTFRNIDAVVNGLDFIGFAGDGSIEDSEMLRSHIVRTKNVVDSAPQAFAGYQQPHQLSAMLGYVLDYWDTPDREAAIDNMAREERKLMAIGAIKADTDSDAHYLTDDEIYDSDRQDVVKNGMVETKPGYRGLFNRIKAAGVNANILSKDADVVTDHTLTSQAVGTIRNAVKKARKDRPKMLRKTRIKNGYVHTSVVKLPQQTATTADTLKILSRTPEGKKLAAAIKQPAVNGLGEIEQGTLTELLHGTDFAFNATDGLSGLDNKDNYRRYFLKLKMAIVDNPKGFYQTKAEADAVIAMLDELYNAIGDDNALDRMIDKYLGLEGGLGKAKLLKKVANAVKKTANKVATTTANATKAVAKAAANTTKAAAKATASAAKNVAKTTASAAKTVAKTTANVAKTAAKSTVAATKAAVQSTVNATKAAANVTKAAAQAATGNKAAAKETLKKAATQAKSAVTQPAKTVVTTTKNVVKAAVVEPTKAIAKTTAAAVKDAAKTTANVAKTVAKETKNVVKAAVVEPTKAVVQATIVNPTKAALKITKKITKKIGKVAKKVIKAVLLYNPITLLIKAGLLIAFRLNMFKIASRSFAGSYNDEQFAAFAEKNGIEVSNFDKFKEAYDKIHHICCDTFGMKESKVLAALEKGSKRKWSGLDAADFTEENKDQFNAQIEEAANEADNSNEFATELDEINADTAADEAALKAQGAQASDEAPDDQLTIEKNIETTEMVEQVENAKVLKANSPLLETASAGGKQLANLQKGETVYVDESQADGNFVAVATNDGKNGFVNKSALAGFSTAEDVMVNGIAGLVDNGYEYVAGLGEAVTAAAGTAAASGWIATICAFIAKIFKGGITLIQRITKGAETIVKTKEAIDAIRNDGNDEIEEAEISQTPIADEQNPEYASLQLQEQQQQQTATKKNKVGLYIGIGATVLAVGAGAYFLLKD